jgi:uncharacterized protein (TIGR03435 family)
MHDAQTFRGTFLKATAAIVVVGAVNALRAQALGTDTTPPAFEVASVKPNNTIGGPRAFDLHGDRLTATNMPLRDLIWEAYGSPAIQLHSQIVGGPSWVASDGFDIAAKADGELTPGPRASADWPDGRPDRALAMLQNLLEDRFKVKVHTEKREVSIYALVLANRGGKLGPRLQPSDCTHPRAATQGPTDSAPACGRFSGLLTGNQNGHGVTLAQLGALSTYWSIRRPVLDRTGLSGAFDFHIEFTPSFVPAPNPGAPMVANPAADSGPNLFTAFREQLGLKLESTRAPVDVLVIDHVEQPTPD